MQEHVKEEHDIEAVKDLYYKLFCWIMSCIIKYNSHISMFRSIPNVLDKCKFRYIRVQF